MDSYYKVSSCYNRSSGSMMSLYSDKVVKVFDADNNCTIRKLPVDGKQAVVNVEAGITTVLGDSKIVAAFHERSAVAAGDKVNVIDAADKAGAVVKSVNVEHGSQATQLHKFKESCMIVSGSQGNSNVHDVRRDNDVVMTWKGAKYAVPDEASERLVYNVTQRKVDGKQRLCLQSHDVRYVPEVGYFQGRPQYCMPHSMRADLPGQPTGAIAVCGKYVLYGYTDAADRDGAPGVRVYDMSSPAERDNTHHADLEMPRQGRAVDDMEVCGMSTVRLRARPDALREICVVVTRRYLLVYAMADVNDAIAAAERCKVRPIRVIDLAAELEKTLKEDCRDGRVTSVVFGDAHDEPRMHMTCMGADAVIIDLDETFLNCQQPHDDGKKQGRE